MADPKIAATAVVDLTQQARYVFKVDGEPFPWWVNEPGPTARKLGDGLYLVRVEILCITVRDDLDPQFEHAFCHDGFETSSIWSQPILLGTEFPWYISYDGITYRHASCRELPIVELQFFAQSVEGMEVTDESDTTRDKVRAADGSVVWIQPTVSVSSRTATTDEAREHIRRAGAAGVRCSPSA